MSASTTTLSPITRLIAKRPHSSSGWTPRMTTRGGGWPVISKSVPRAEQSESLHGSHSPSAGVRTVEQCTDCGLGRNVREGLFSSFEAFEEGRLRPERKCHRYLK